MLTLDEKKIRKGKPIRLPYQGSKKKISKKIIEIIKQNFGTNKPIYDVFGVYCNGEYLSIEIAHSNYVNGG